MSFDGHVRGEEQEALRLAEIAKSWDYPPIPDGCPGAYSVETTEDGEIRIIDRSGRTQST